MSRMVRESEISGLRERLFFAQTLLDSLRADSGGPHGHRLALRGAVIFHLYSVLLGLLRQAARSYRVTGYETALSLIALEDAFHQAGVESPEMNLVRQARRQQGGLIGWLDQEMFAACGASGMARRPLPPAEEDALAIQLEDPAVPLGDKDIQRLADCATEVARLVADSHPYSEEW